MNAGIAFVEEGWDQEHNFSNLGFILAFIFYIILMAEMIVRNLYYRGWKKKKTTNFELPYFKTLATRKNFFYELSKVRTVFTFSLCKNSPAHVGDF